MHNRTISSDRRAALIAILAALLIVLSTILLAGARPADLPAWQEPRLIKNILSKTGDSSVYPVAEMNGSLFFGANGLGVEQNLSELWRTDGTPGGTILLEQRYDGTSFSPSFVLDNKLFFLAPHPDYGTELWISDGTPGDAQVMGDAFPDPWDGQVANHTVSGNYLYFTAYDNVNLTELWRTDGTLAGTIRLTGPDLGLDVGLGGPLGLIDFDGTLFFTGYTEEDGSMLFKSDGTVAGTTLVKAVDGTGIGGSMHVANGLLYFLGRDIWRSDGTTNGTYVIQTFPDDRGIPEFGSIAAASKVYFAVMDNNHDYELWQTTGTAATTTKIVDLPAFHGRMATVGDRLFFVGGDQDHGAEPWTSDGTLAGTVMVKDIKTGSDGSNVDKIITAGAYAYFAADTATKYKELWRSNGTLAGTTQVSLPGASVEGPMATPLAPFNNELFFQATDNSHGSEPWMTTGGGTSAVFLQDINFIDALSSSPGGFNYANDTLFFLESGGLWRSDGSEAGTSLLVENVWTKRQVLGYPTGIAGNKLYFLINDSPSSMVELWRTDGTVAGTFLIHVAAPMYRMDPVAAMADVNGLLYYARFAQGQPRKELWLTDGTTGGTKLIATPNTLIDPIESSEIDQITGVGSMGYFVANNGLHGVELWRSNGTTAGTAIVKDIRLGGAGSAPSNLTAAGAHLFFFADDGSHGRELWRSDGTAAGTVMVKDIRPGSASSDPSELTFFNGLVYFTAENGAQGRELWRSDGTAAGTTMVRDILPAGSSNPRQLVAGDDWLFFFASDSEGLNPYKTNGTAAGTYRIAIIQYKDFEYPESLTAVGNMIFFTVGLNASADVLYQSDGTPAGTIAQHVAYPDFQAYNISQLTPAPGRLFFAATHLMHGNEPFVKNLSLAENSPSTVYLPEGSSYSYFRLTLNVIPNAPVTVHFTTDDPTVEIEPSMVTITPQNWNVPVSIGVLAADDGQPGVREATITQTFDTADSSIDGVVIELPLRIGWKFGFMPVAIR